MTGPSPPAPIEEIRARIDPEIRTRLDRFLETVGPHGLAGIEDIPQRRRRQAELVAAIGRGPLPRDVEIRDHALASTRDAPLVLRSYRPIGLADPAPCAYYLHGGGLVAGSVAGDDGKAAALARDVGCTVVAVEYRLAPEHRYPAALDDCVRGLHWLVDRHQDLNVDRERIAVFGSSAGGGLAVATALHLRDHGGPPVAYLVLVSPMLDDRSSSPSARISTGFGAWSREANLQAWRAYLGTHQGGERLSPYAAPARARDVTGLPPTFIDTGELDLLRDEALDLARRLMWAGVPVELHVHPGAIHGGESLAPAAAVSRRARALRIDALTRTFRERTA